MAEVTALKRQRTTIKSSCTRIKTYMDGLTELDPEIIAHLVERKKRLEVLWDEYNDVQTKIEIVDENEVQDREGFENTYYNIAARLSSIIVPRNANNIQAIVQPPNNQQIAADQNPGLQVRLPKLDLPKFSGRYDEWIPFFNVFRSVIHDNAALGKTQKFQYLQSALVGEASDVIQSIELSDENYDTAFELLQERFNNNRVIVYTHIKEILELPNIQKENSRELKRLVDTTLKHTRALKSLQRPTDSWDDILVYILVSKLDSVTAREWQASLAGTELPTLKKLLDFITQKYLALEVSINKFVLSNSKNSAQQQSTSKRHTATHVVTTKGKCGYCKGEHPIYFCAEFSKLPVDSRVAEIRKRKLCTNCLRTSNHGAMKCTSGVCKECGAKHNSLLHINKTNNVNSTTSSDNNKQADEATSSRVISGHTYIKKVNNAMLSTALVYVNDVTGLQHTARVLLDSGSQANFISRQLLESLGFKARPINISVSTMFQTVSSANQMISMKIKSRINSFTAEFDCIVVDRITEKLPFVSFPKNDIKVPGNIRLADPQFNVSSNIDILIGVDLFWNLLCVGQIKATNEHPLIQWTQLGWILAGRMLQHQYKSQRVNNFCLVTQDRNLEFQLDKFWRLDDISEKSNNFTLNEQLCEEHFLQHVTRNEEGRFVVKLPTINGIIQQIGDSRSIAINRFVRLEKRLSKDRSIRDQYSKFMREYISLKHMKKIEIINDSDAAPNFYFPHHSVIKLSSATTKLRVVVDASCKSDTGISLNDALMVGPVVQQDLISILIRFRTFRFVMTADITKMYRQILIDSTQTRLQRIVWRDGPNVPLDTYELLTLTYGTAPASYIATKCIKVLAEREGINYPIGAQHVARDFYVDDLLTGADTIERLQKVRDEIIEIMKRGCFSLNKWASNATEVLDSPQIRDSANAINFDKEIQTQVLGVRWNASIDIFHYFINDDCDSERTTKRNILSYISRIFDPLGLIAPIIVVAKLIIQELWQNNCDWDESIPMHMHTRWMHIKNQLGSLNRVEIPRFVGSNPTDTNFQLHGFSDASQAAYGACVYIRSRNNDNSFYTGLLCAKSRVAPLKNVSLPRLELCAALLLAQLMDKVKGAIEGYYISLV